MSYNGKLLARARGALEERRAANEAEQRRRTEEVCARVPAVREADRALRAQMVTLAGLALRHGGDTADRIAALEKENLALQARRAELLVGAGYPADYTDPIYSCPRCHDTGMAGSQPCECLKKLYNRELTAELGTLLRGGDERFDAFDLSLYDDFPDPRTGIVPRECMSLVLRTCRDWADGFGRSSESLLFRGGTGLGKTYLSACIAREVAARGFSVAYESAAAALGAFEASRFSRDPAEADEAAARVKQYLTCDLMILDDLGTEMVTSFSVSALYSLMNGRLTAPLPTIISTNCPPEELARKYTPQILSRLEGEYTLVPFVGRDIRLLKKEMP